MESSGIYKITAPSGRMYVGSAVHFEKRWRRHRTYLRMGAHHNGPLQRAFDKYGESAIRFAPLIICRPQDLLLYEQIAIDTLNPQYNICRTAGSHLGVKRSNETLLRMSEAQRKRAPPSAETLIKMGNAKRGKPQSEAANKKRSESLRAFYSNPEAVAKRSAIARATNARPEVRAKISAASKGVPKSASARRNMSAAQMGHPSKLKGVPRSAEVKAKISATKQAKMRHVSEN